MDWLREMIKSRILVRLAENPYLTRGELVEIIAKELKVKRNLVRVCYEELLEEGLIFD